MFYAVVKNLEIIGEAAYRLTKTFRKEHPDAEWDNKSGCVMSWYMTTIRLIMKRFGILFIMT